MIDQGLEATGLKTKTIVHKSAAPIYAAAVTWVLYALLFPLYQVGHFLLAAAAAAVVALIARIFCKDVTEEVEIPEEPVTTGNPELDKMIADGNGAIQAMRALNDSIQDETISAQIDRLRTLAGKCSQLQGDLNALAAASDVSGLLEDCGALTDAIRDLTGGLPVTDSDLRRQLDTVVSDVSDTLSGVRTLSADARALQAALSGTTAALNTTVDLLRPAAERMVSALSDTIDKLEGLSADEYMDMLLEILGGDPIAYSQYFPQMVQTTVHKVYPIANYGSAMAPFYTTLAIWVGCVILSTLIKVHARTDGLIDPTPAELYFGRYLFFFLLSQIQAAVIVTGDLYLLGIQCEHPGLLYLTASLTAFTFSLLIYSLALSFGDVGKALVVVVMVMQIAGSSGTFPIELLPEIYQKIYRFFPFPYAIDAMRECICGLYGDYYIRQLAFLLLFVAAALLIGLLVRRPFMGLNRFMEEKLEETELL